MAHVFKRAGLGRRVAQYNPGRGAESLGAWMAAVESMKGESDQMSVADAVALIKATPDRSVPLSLRKFGSAAASVGRPACRFDKEMRARLTRRRNQSELPYDEWIPAHAVLFHSDGRVSLVTEQRRNPSRRRFAIYNRELKKYIEGVYETLDAVILQAFTRLRRSIFSN